MFDPSKFDPDKKIIYNYYFGFNDFPKKFALSLYFPKCNLNCPWCYNQHCNSGNPNFSFNDTKNKLEKSDFFRNTVLILKCLLSLTCH